MYMRFIYRDAISISTCISIHIAQDQCAAHFMHRAQKTFLKNLKFYSFESIELRFLYEQCGTNGHSKSRTTCPFSYFAFLYAFLLVFAFAFAFVFVFIFAI